MKSAIAFAVLFATAVLAHAAESHSVKGTVKRVDEKGGTVALDHEAVQSLKWPAMTMSFRVQDKALLEKLPVGKKVEVAVEQRGREYVIVGAK